MFKMDCQKDTTQNIRHKKRTIKNKISKNWEKKLEQRIVQGVKTTLMILNHKKQK